MAIDSYIQMRLYTLTKRQFLFLFVMFFFLFFLSLVIGWLGPSVLDDVTEDIAIKTKDNKISIVSPKVSVSQQQLWLQIEPQMSRSPPGKPSFERVSYLTVPLRSKLFAFTNGSISQLNVHSQNTRARNRTVECFHDKCLPVMILHLGTIEFSQYYVEIEISEALGNGSSFKPIWTTYNSQFTILELWFRFIFLILATIALVILCRALWVYSIQEWSIEQKWMVVLLISVMLYDNPLFPLILLVHTSFTAIVDACFTVTFFSTLLMFWLCVYHGIRKSERNFFSFYLPKLLLVGLLWIIGCVMLSWSALYQSLDPTYSIAEDEKGFFGIKVFYFTLLGVYSLYLMYLLVRAYSELHSMPYFDVRLKFLTALTVIILLISMVAVIIRFGRAILEDSIIMEITLRWNNSAEFLCFYSLFNFYLFTLAFVYSPSKTAMKYRETPSFAALSDSEDDVLYRGKKFVNHQDEDEESM